MYNWSRYCQGTFVLKLKGGYNQTHYFHLPSVSVGLLQRNEVFHTSVFSLKCSAVQVSTHSYNLDCILLPGIKILYYCFILSPCNLQLACFPTCHQKQIREIRKRMVSMHCLACLFLSETYQNQFFIVWLSMPSTSSLFRCNVRGE